MNSSNSLDDDQQREHRRERGPEIDSGNKEHQSIRILQSEFRKGSTNTGGTLSVQNLRSNTQQIVKARLSNHGWERIEYTRKTVRSGGEKALPRNVYNFLEPRGRKKKNVICRRI